jgi:hypothetical protein
LFILILWPLYWPFCGVNQDIVGLAQQLFQAGQFLGFAGWQALEFKQGLSQDGQQFQHVPFGRGSLNAKAQAQHVETRVSLQIVQ